MGPLEHKEPLSGLNNVSRLQNPDVRVNHGQVKTLVYTGTFVIWTMDIILIKTEKFNLLKITLENTLTPSCPSPVSL